MEKRGVRDDENEPPAADKRAAADAGGPAPCGDDVASRLAEAAALRAAGPDRRPDRRPS